MAKANPADTGDQPSSPNQKHENLPSGLMFLKGSIAGKKKEAWKKVEEEFHKHAVDGKLFKDKFGACIGMDKDSKNFADELFDVMSKRKKLDSQKGISQQQLQEIWEELNKDDLDTRLDIFFDFCDKNDDNKISVEEMEAVLEWTASANKLTNIKEKRKYYASLIVQHLDPDGNGTIEIEHMKHLVEGLWNHEEAKTGESQDVSGSSSFVREKIETMKENRKIIWFFTLWLTINVGLFVWKFMEYKEKQSFEVLGYCIGVAKGSAETLKFNMGLVLFLACRGTLTKLRQSTFLSFIFPFDDHIYIHMVVGFSICLATFVHMIMHFLSRCLSSNLQEPSYFDFVLSVPGVTGILMVIIMLYCFKLAFPMFNSEKKLLIDFNAFWNAHHFLSLLYLLIIFHGFFISLAWDWLNRTTWIYISFPILLYAIERLFSGEEVKVIKSQVSSGDALVTLYLEKPKGFKYESGMYLFVKCPEISKSEWHPFSITSAPGDEHISLHIGQKGDWKRELLKIFKTVEKKDTKASQSSEKYPKIFIKGPYGAPTQNYKDFDFLLLIGLGVGATPMVSILKDVLNHIKIENASQSQSKSQGNDTSPKEVKSPSTSVTPTTKVPKRAYFYWVTRTEESFQWFNGVMNDIASYDDGKVIELHNHLSSIHTEGDIRSLLVTILQNIPGQKDVISRTPIRTHYGRPNWEKVFQDLEKKHEGSKIGVFYCGLATSSTGIRRLCRKHSLGSTKFHFFKENF